ncbi:MAG: hypothetical protein HQL49_04915 [Gammaproteobacteria bacterium]|nr:hypothetical protein [Gammaproteobacteria bacterium]
MLLHPAIMALLLLSLLVTAMLLPAALFALQILRHWNMQSGSARQLALERKTYLISTLLTWVFTAELLSLFLFIYSAEALSGQFVGAMCATGVLNINAWGWPTLWLKIVTFFAGSLWLIMNQLDNHGYDFPLIRQKYILLLLIVPLLLAGGYSQLSFFSALNPEVITSCCGSLFSADAQGVAAELSGIAPKNALLMLTVAALILCVTAYLVLKQGTRLTALAFSITALLFFAIALSAIVSAVALYIYQHPHHHCPFCLLKAGHHYSGYLLYLPLFVATALALPLPFIARCQAIPSLSATAHRWVKQLSRSSLALYLLFLVIVLLEIAASPLRLLSQ